MALRLRRGTDAQRQLITPTEGELIYVTDTTELYVGDGTTQGGVRITGEVVNTITALNDVDAALSQDGDILQYDSATGDWVAGELPIGDLSNVDTVSTPPTDGSILNYDADSQSWVVGSPLGADSSLGGLNNVSERADTASTLDFLTYSYEADEWGPTDITDLTFKINIRASDSSLLLDSDNDQFNGNVVGDVTGNLTGIVTGNVVQPGTDDVIVDANNGQIFASVFGTFDGDVTGSVFADDSALMIDGVNAKVVGPIDTNSFNLTGDAIISGGVFASTLQGDLTGDVTGDAAGDHTGTFTGSINATGTFDGDVTGSVFADNSTAVIDGVTGDVVGNVINASVISDNIRGGDVRVGGTLSNSVQALGTNDLLLSTETDTNLVIVPRNVRIGGTTATIPDTTLNVFNDTQNVFAAVLNHASDSSNSVAFAVQKARGNKAAPTAVQSGDILGAFIPRGYNGSSYANAGGIRTVANGSPSTNNVPAQVEIITFNSSGVPSAKLTVQDSGTTEFAGPAQLVSLTTTERDALTAANGMMIYNETTNKVQARAGGSWVDLH